MSKVKPESKCSFVVTFTKCSVHAIELLVATIMNTVYSMPPPLPLPSSCRFDLPWWHGGGGNCWKHWHWPRTHVQRSRLQVCHIHAKYAVSSKTLSALLVNAPIFICHSLLSVYKLLVTLLGIILLAFNYRPSQLFKCTAEILHVHV